MLDAGNEIRKLMKFRPPYCGELWLGKIRVLKSKYFILFYYYFWTVLPKLLQCVTRFSYALGGLADLVSTKNITFGMPYCLCSFCISSPMHEGQARSLTNPIQRPFEKVSKINHFADSWIERWLDRINH